MLSSATTVVGFCISCLCPIPVSRIFVIHPRICRAKDHELLARRDRQSFILRESVRSSDPDLLDESHSIFIVGLRGPEKIRWKINEMDSGIILEHSSWPFYNSLLLLFHLEGTHDVWEPTAPIEPHILHLLDTKEAKIPDVNFFLVFAGELVRDAQKNHHSLKLQKLVAKLKLSVFIFYPDGMG